MACAALGLIPAVGHAAAVPGAADPRLAAEQRISSLYQQAAATTQQFDADEENIGRLQAAVSMEAEQSAATVQLLTQLSSGLGRMAAQQYRDSDYGSSLALMFTINPDHYLQRADLDNRVAALDAEQVHAAQLLQGQLADLSAFGRQDLLNLEETRVALARERIAIEYELSQARARLDSLDAVDRHAVAAALATGEDDDGFGTGIAARAPALSSLLDAVTAAAAAGAAGGPGIDANRAQRAISAAYSELGKPYIWGAVGPAGFDCSGLMQHVWAQAGVMLPRTSQEQATIGPSVPLDQIQPGDLVIYFHGRTHVGLYVGQGLVIHAPRPGSEVQFAPVGAMPIDKVVRPDGG